MELPTLHAVGAILVAAGAIWLYARGRMRIEFVSLLLIAVLALLLNFFPVEREGARGGLEIAFSGFGHPALIAICCLMILGRGLVVTGALEPAARVLTQLWRSNRSLGLLVTLLVAAGISMFINDTPVLVLLLPLLLNLTQRVGAAASQTLMPVNCAILIGGMSTTIGTSTNLLVVSIADDLGLRPIGVFDFTGIALSAALIALPYLWFVMPRLLPKHLGEKDESQRKFQAAFYISAATGGGSMTVEALRQALAEHHLRLLRLVTFNGQVIGSRPLADGDIVRVEGAPNDIREVSEILKAPLAHPAVLASLRVSAMRPSEEEVIAELVVGSESSLIDKTIRSAQIADRYGVLVVGIHRPDRTLTHSDQLLNDVPMEIGDVLLVRGSNEALRRLQLAEGAMVLAGAAEMPLTALAPVAVAIFVGVVGLAAFHVLPITISALAGAILMMATRCVKFENLGRALSGEVIVLVAASIALGQTLIETGAANWLGTTLAFLLQSAPPAAMVAAMMAFSATLTNFSSNTAAAAVSTPIAVSLAQQVGTQPEPLVLAVLFGCNLCFATPMAYQTNILIMGAGGYNFRDYVRAGLPLVLLLIVTLTTLLVLKYRL